MSNKHQVLSAAIIWTGSQNFLVAISYFLCDSKDSLRVKLSLLIYLHHSNLSLSPYILSVFKLVVMASPQRFLGNSLLQWNNMAAASASVPWHVELMFRTRQASATLMHISSGLQHNLTLQVRLTPFLTAHGYTHTHLFCLHSFCWRPSCLYIISLHSGFYCR